MMLQCCDSVDWVTGRASDMSCFSASQIPKVVSVDTALLEQLHRNCLVIQISKGVMIQ